LGTSRSTVASLAILLLTALAGAACSRKPAPRQYTLTGQILGVDVDRRQLTIKHDDIPNFMPAMTMTYPVTAAALMDGRHPGELVTATLEVDDATGRLTAITHTGDAPLPPGNEVALATDMLEVGDAVPDVALIDQTNRRRSLSDWRGRYALLTFVYTRCPLPTFCPLMDQNFVTLQQAIGEDTALRGKVQLISISFDPEFDTPEVLAAHATRLHADPNVWTWLTGDRVTIDRLAGRFGVGVLRTADPTQITHTLRTVLVDPDGRIAKIYPHNDWTPGAVLADLRTTVRRP
jgi:protein SCO1/2